MPNLTQIMIGAATVLFGIMAIALLVLWLLNTRLHAQLTAATGDAATAHMLNTQLSDQLATQNKAIADIQKQSEIRATQAAQAEHKAESAAQALIKNANALAKLQAGKDQCAAAAALLTRYRKAIKP